MVMHIFFSSLWAKFPHILEILQLPGYNFSCPFFCFLFQSTEPRHLERNVAKQGCDN